jgi:hypothetical protein
MNLAPLSRPLRAIVGAAIILIVILGSALAASIAIGNSNKPSEFGQGVFQLKVCDSWIQLNLVSGATGQYGAPAGYSALTGVSLQGLDVSQCKSKKFTIQAVDSSNNILPIYRTDKKVQMCSVNPGCVIGRNSESDLILMVSSSGIASLYNPDIYHQMTFDGSTGLYTFSFTQPGQLAQGISSLIIQSSAA